MLYVSKREFANLNYGVLLCGNNIKSVEYMDIVYITPETVQKICGVGPEPPRLDIVWSVATKHKDTVINKVHVNVLLQYEDAVIILPEGVSYHMTKRPKKTLV